MNRLLQCVAGSAMAISASGTLSKEAMKLPPLKKQPTEQKLVDEHLDGLNKCDWNRLMAAQVTTFDGSKLKFRK